ncbi:MAG: EthD family reductase [Actinomycetota bacterium]
MKVMVALIRRDDMTREEFLQWWLHEHAPLARTLPGVQRIRFNVLEEDAPYDGIAELWFESAEAADAAYATDIGKAVAADSMAHVSARVRMFADEHAVLG